MALLSDRRPENRLDNPPPGSFKWQRSAPRSCVVPAESGVALAMKVIRVSAWVLCLATSATADEFGLAWPVDCYLGVDCSIQQYVDRDPTTNVRDFRCGTLSYDGHNGTDIRVSTVAAMKEGMAVLAAQAGTVTGVRDGMPDIDVNAEVAVDVSGRECGNGVVISHGDGWDTQYCHLRRSTLQIQAGDRVEQGQRLGDIGMSGRATFPHLHFSVRRNGAVVDPFAPDSISGCSDETVDQLWLALVPYVATGLLDAGFSTKIPPFAAVKNGLPVLPSLPQEATGLVIWATYFGSRAGDQMRFRINGPEGFRFEHDYNVERDQAQAMQAAGQLRPQDGWPPGLYTAILTYSRNAALQWRVERQITILP